MIKAFFEAFFNIFKRPATVAEVKLFEGNRGLIGFDENECIWCYKCENACPPGAIQYVRGLDGLDTYHYNPYLCIYCGDCVKACPKPDQALWQEETLALGGTDPLISKDWYLIESESKRTKKEIKKAKRG